MTWRNPDWTKEKQQSFMTKVEAICSKPDAENIMTIHGRFDLEVVICVHPDDEHVFMDASTIETLKQSLKDEVGVMAPVVYLDGHEDAYTKDLIESKMYEV